LFASVCAPSQLTLWDKYTSIPGDQLEQMVGAAQHPVLAVKNARVGDFNGRSLSTLNSSTVLVDPVDRPETGALRTW
jgi:replication factor A1